MIKAQLVGSDGKLANQVSVLVESPLFFPELAVTADISAAVAKAAPKPIPVFPTWVMGRWPMWQVSTRFSAGTTKDADLTIHVRDAVTQEWHALSLIDAIDAADVTNTNGQVIQFEAPGGKDALAIEVALTTADDRPHISVRGIAYAQVAL